MKQHSKLTHEQQSEQASNQTSQNHAQEFSTAEELLRHDAAQTTVPPAVAERLRQSAATLPQPKASWWKRWFGGAR
jgi:hypothetical protein